METIKTDQIILKINNVLFEKMYNKNISFKIDNLSNQYNQTIYIDLYNYSKVYGSKFDGMQIIYENGIFEVSEYQAGKNQNELHIYKETRSFIIALKTLLKGNKQNPIKIIN
jgi:hypothetical protein